MALALCAHAQLAFWYAKKILCKVLSRGGKMHIPILFGEIFSLRLECFAHFLCVKLKIFRNISPDCVTQSSTQIFTFNFEGFFFFFCLLIWSF
jgi:hypothetical protein